LDFAKYLEPENKDIDCFLQNYDPAHVRSTLGEELKVNPYLRFNTPEMMAVLEKRGLSTNTEEDRWRSLMSIE
jgi:hydroxyacylglutathione hydrolase